MDIVNLHEQLGIDQSIKITNRLNFLVANHWIAKITGDQTSTNHFEEVIRKIFNHFKDSNQIGPILNPIRWYNQETIELIHQLEPKCIFLPIKESNVTFSSLLSWDDGDPVYD